MEEVVIREILKDEMKTMVQRLAKEQLFNDANPQCSGLFISYRAILNSPDHHVDRMWVGFLNDSPIAVATIEEPFYIDGVILNLFVKPQHRRQGIGERLLNLVSSEETGFRVFHTDTSHGLYTRHGSVAKLKEYGYCHIDAYALESP